MLLDHWFNKEHQCRIRMYTFLFPLSSSSFSLALTVFSFPSLLLHLCKCWACTQSCVIQLSSFQLLDNNEPRALRETCKQLELKWKRICQYKLLNFTTQQITCTSRILSHNTIQLIEMQTALKHWHSTLSLHWVYGKETGQLKRHLCNGTTALFLNITF